MVLTPSTMMPIGTKAPYFRLPDTVSGGDLGYDDIRSEVATVIMFICNHCPYVKHVIDQLAALALEYKRKEVSFVAINSNDVENYPDDSPEKMKVLAISLGNPFPYLFDETQEVARAYRAACTPDFYIFDRNDQCVYRGQLDDSRPGSNIPVSGQDIRSALDAVLAGESVSTDQKPSIGCNIKWKS